MRITNHSRQANTAATLTDALRNVSAWQARLLISNAVIKREVMTRLGARYVRPVGRPQKYYEKYYEEYYEEYYAISEPRRPVE